MSPLAWSCALVIEAGRLDSPLVWHAAFCLFRRHHDDSELSAWVHDDLVALACSLSDPIPVSVWDGFAGSSL